MFRLLLTIFLISAGVFIYSYFRELNPGMVMVRTSSAVEFELSPVTLVLISMAIGAVVVTFVVGMQQTAHPEQGNAWYRCQSSTGARGGWGYRLISAGRPKRGDHAPEVVRGLSSPGVCGVLGKLQPALHLVAVLETVQERAWD